MNLPKISKRLEAAASFARRGERIADVGTDHAYLPIYLYAKGMTPGGVASDINEGPVNRARINVRGWGAAGAFEVLRADGLDGIEKYAVGDIYVLGMGGELIANIIDAAEWVRDSKIRLILQPMTHPEILRAYLYENGFEIVDECLVSEDKIYQIICAQYRGGRREVSLGELYFGRHNLERGGELLRELLLRARDVYQKRALGKGLSDNADTSEEQKMLDEIERILGGTEK